MEWKEKQSLSGLEECGEKTLRVCTTIDEAV